LMNRVNRICKSLKTLYFIDKVQKLKNGNSSQWWKNMKSICRFSHQPSDSECFSNITYHSVPADSCNLASTINTHLCEVTKHIHTLDQSRLDDLRNKLPPLPSQYTDEIEEVRSLLCKIKLNKSVGPDGISHKILTELANYLAAPITA